MIHLLIQMIYRVSFIILLAFIFSKITLTKSIIKKKQLALKNKIYLGLFFGFLGIIGTITGIPFEHAIVNTRVIGIVVGALIGGPITGVIAGLTAGIHRFLIDPWGFTSLSCALSTLVEGLIAGFLSEKFYKSNNKIAFSISVGIVCEALQMLIVLVIAKPTSEAYELVQIIAIPMIFMNSIGIGLFISVIENLKEIGEIEGAYRSYQTLLIADKTLAELRYGLNKKSARKITEIIYKSTDFNAVAITDTNKILAHKGDGEDHHLPGKPIKTTATLKVLQTNKLVTVNDANGIDCNEDGCSLKNGLIVPLTINNNPIGTLKLYNPTTPLYSKINFELAKGLGNIFSNQLMLSQIEEQKNLKSKAELHALQAQINPHFLFNAINTIVSFVRTDANQARDLLLHLSDYFRHNMNNEKDFITLTNELNHVNAYVKIEKARFDKRLDFTINNSITNTVYIPPLTIQPLVENAIKHGILPLKSGGKVTVTIDKTSNNKINISVKDNGIGIKKQNLSTLQNFSSNSIGLNNVYKRLKLAFNDHIIFDIKSYINNGTTIKIQIPEISKVKGDNND